MVESVSGYDARGAAVARRDVEVQRQRVDRARDNERVDDRAQERAAEARKSDEAAAARHRQRVDVKA